MHLLKRGITALLVMGLSFASSMAISGENEKPYLEGATLKQAVSGVTLNAEYRFLNPATSSNRTYQQTHLPTGNVRYSDKYTSLQRGWWSVSGPRLCYYYSGGATRCYHVFKRGNCLYYVDDKYPPASQKWMIKAVPEGEEAQCS